MKHKCEWCDSQAEYYNDDNGEYLCFKCLCQTIGIEHVDNVLCAKCKKPCETDLTFFWNGKYFCSPQCAIKNFGHAHILMEK